jgi:sigma-B regulation protein RsbU (phosphoserine phosphatase)
MYRIRCAEIWGGIGSQDEDVCSGGIFASLYSNAHDGDRGGDIYYLSVCGSDRLTRVAIADVAGHGAQVSDVSQRLYAILEAHMNDTGCDEVLRALNRSAVQHGIRAFTTAAVAGFYTTDSNLYFAYAGHEPVLLRRKGSEDWQPLELDAASTRHSNAPLGVIPDTGFDQQRLPLSPGDRLFLHTDGLTEAMNDRGELFGKERLNRALSRAGGEALPALKRSVLDAVTDHTAGATARDDLTLLAIEVR